MDVTRFRQQSRAASPLSSAQPRPTASAITIGSIRTPSSAKSNTLVDASVTISNGHSFIGGWDPNYCETPFLRQVGSSITVTVYVDGVEHDRETNCVPGGGGSKDFGLTIQTPDVPEGQSEDVEVLWDAEYANTGDPGDTYTKTVSVSTDSEPPSGDQCIHDDDCPAGEVCQDGACVGSNGNGGGPGPLLPCFLDPNRSCATPETMAWGVVGVLGLSLVISR